MKYYFSVPFMLFLALITVILTGCQHEQAIPDGYFSYNEDKVHTAVDQLSFKPDLPGFLPIKVDFIISDLYTDIDTNSEAIDVSFYTIDNDLLSIQIVKGVSEQELPESEKVQIAKDIDGQYVNNSYAKTLTWKVKGICYKIIYRSSTVTVSEEVTKNDVNKSELIEVAKSFHS